MENKGAEFLGVSGTARRLEISEPQVRKLADLGILPVIRDSAGRRLFDPKDVERLAKERRGRADAGR